MTPRASFKQRDKVHELLTYYQDNISSGILLFAAFIILRLFSHSKMSRTATNTTSSSRRGTVIPAATGAVIEPCALIVTEGVLDVAVRERDGLRSVVATDELNVDTLVGTAKQNKKKKG